MSLAGIQSIKPNYRLWSGTVPVWLPPVALTLLSLLVYANSFPGTFVQDDLVIVAKNDLVRDFDIIKIFRSDYWSGIENSGLYRPISILSLALNQFLTGTDVWGFHLGNLLLHIGVVILLWLVLLQLGLSRSAAFIGSALFAVHPVHTEVVDIVVGRSELLVALFLLLAILLSRKSGKLPQIGLFTAFALAMLSKEHAVVLLAILPLCDAFLARSITVWRRRWPLYLGLCVMVVGWLLLREYGVEHQGPRSQYSAHVVPLKYLPWDERILSALLYQWVYLLKLGLGYKLQTAYSLTDLPEVIHSFWSVKGLLVVTATCAIVGLFYCGIRRWQSWGLLLGCYLISFIPTSNILFAIGVTFAERLAYFPSLWFCGLLGMVASAALQRQRVRNYALGLILCLVGYFSILTIMRNPLYQSELELWSAEVQQNPEDILGLYNYAEVLSLSHRYNEAERVYLELLAKEPDFHGALRSYVSSLVAQRRYADALVPAYHVYELSRRDADPSGIAYDIDTLGQLYLELNQPEKALELLRNPEAGLHEDQNYHHVLLGRAYAMKGDYDQALTAFNKVESYDSDPEFLLYYGMIYLRLGNLDQAGVKLREALRFDDNAEAWNMLGTIEARQERFVEAAQAFQRAVDLEPENRFYRQNFERVDAINNAGR